MCARRRYPLSKIRHLAAQLTAADVPLSLLTAKQLYHFQYMTALVSWLHALASSCDPLSNLVSTTIAATTPGTSLSTLTSPLQTLLAHDLHLPAPLRTRLHSLFLTLLASPSFKHSLAVAYATTYTHSTTFYTRGIGAPDSNAYSLSVQFLNRTTFVNYLVANHQLLHSITSALYTAYSYATVEGGGIDTDHHVMRRRRYSHVVSDLKCVLNVENISLE